MTEKDNVIYIIGYIMKIIDTIPFNFHVNHLKLILKLWLKKINPSLQC